jgi:hypothetical protein
MIETNNIPPRCKAIKKYQYLAGLQESTGEIIYSRARHDFRNTSDSQGYVDGGNDYFRGSGVKLIMIELSISPAELYEDWNKEMGKYGFAIKNKNGKLIQSPEFIRIVPTEEFEDKKSFEYKKKYFTWGTYGKNGDQPRKVKMLTELDTDHLEAILDTQSHISPETRLIIESILEDRKKS